VREYRTEISEQYVEPRTAITHVSLTPDDFFGANYAVYSDEGQDYLSPGIEEATEDDLINRHRYTVSEGRGILDKLVDEFPTGKSLSLVEQSALWLRAVAGLHLSYDANHRTGMATLRRTMGENGIEPFEPFEEYEKKTRSALQRSGQVRKQTTVTAESMYEKDGMYSVWRDYFEDVLSS